MIGLSFLATLAIWLWACFWLSGFVSNKVPKPSWRGPVKWGLLIALLASPFVDEVIGMYQFDSLCKANGIESADVSKARGKRVKVDYDYRHRTLVGGTVMPIVVNDVWFRDVDSGEILIHHKDYYASGGWLMRYTPISLGHVHSMFDGNGCGFSHREQIFKSNHIEEIN